MLGFSWLPPPSGFTCPHILAPLILPLQDYLLACLLLCISADLPHLLPKPWPQPVLLCSTLPPPCPLLRDLVWSLWQVTLHMVSSLSRLFPFSKNSLLPEDGVCTLLTGHVRPCWPWPLPASPAWPWQHLPTTQVPGYMTQAPFFAPAPLHMIHPKHFHLLSCSVGFF